jgi:hypothetical protein
VIFFEISKNCNRKNVRKKKRRKKREGYVDVQIFRHEKILSAKYFRRK